jgi:hypothetical protein
MAHPLKIRKIVQKYTHWTTGEPKKRAVFTIAVPRRIATHLPDDARFTPELTLEGDLLYRRVDDVGTPTSKKI